MGFILLILVAVSVQETNHTPHDYCVKKEVQKSGMVDVERCVEWYFGPTRQQTESKPWIKDKS